MATSGYSMKKFQRKFFNLSELKYVQYALKYVLARLEGRNGYRELFQ